MTKPTDQWMDPQQWMGQFTEHATNAIDMTTQQMKQWNDQVKQTLGETTKAINATMENIVKMNDEAYRNWETSINQLKETYKPPKK